MFHEVKNIFHVIIIFQCLFFASFLLTLKNGRRNSNRLLAAFLVVRAFAELGGFFFHFLALRELLLAKCPQLFYIDLPFDYLYIPLLYFYILSLTKKDFMLKKSHLLHFGLPFLVALFVIFRYEFRSAEAIRAVLRPDFRLPPLEHYLFMALDYLQFSCYAATALIVLKKYRRDIKDVFSTVEAINLSWLSLILYGFIAWRSLALFEYTLWLVTGSGHLIYSLYILSEITFLFFISLLFWRGIRQPSVFTGETSNHVRQKYEKTLLPDDLKESYKAKLVRYMETQKPYLDPLLSLPELARKVAIPPHHLSQTLNTCLHQNFFDFVNSYRIKESQKILAESGSREKTILEILYDTGFNSKSVFNTVFKKCTGMTPTEFRKMQNSRVH